MITKPIETEKKTFGTVSFVSEKIDKKGSIKSNWKDNKSDLKTKKQSKQN